MQPWTRHAARISLVALVTLGLVNCGTTTNRAGTPEAMASVSTAGATHAPASPTTATASSPLAQQPTSATVTAADAQAATVSFACDALVDGATLALPASVLCHITGFAPDDLTHVRVQLTADNVGPASILQLAFGADGQTLTLPDDKRLTGRRNLVFELVGADGSLIASPGARLVVHDVTLTGRR